MLTIRFNLQKQKQMLQSLQKNCGRFLKLLKLTLQFPLKKKAAQNIFHLFVHLEDKRLNVDFVQYVTVYFSLQ